MKSTQQLADELARNCAKAIGEKLADTTLKSKVILDSIPLLELLEIARINMSDKPDFKECDCDLCVALTNLQKKVEL